MDRQPPSVPIENPYGESRRSWSGKLGVGLLLGALALMFAAVSTLVFTAPLSRNDLGLLGGLRVVADSDTAIYVADRPIGTGTVDVSWNELLGAAGRPPLAIPINDPPADNQLPALLGLPQAEVVWTHDGLAGAHRGSQHANYFFQQVLLKRSSGEFDHLFLIRCEFPNSGGAWHQLLLPIRTRRTGESAVGYFPQAGSQSGGNVHRGMIPSRRDNATFELKLTVAAGAAPEVAASELVASELWTPPTQ